MTAKPNPVAIADKQTSWLPMAIILMAQIQMGFNVNAIPVDPSSKT